MPINQKEVTPQLDSQTGEDQGEEEEQPEDENRLEKFTVRLNGQHDLEQRLKDFKAACEAHEKHARRRKRKRYYHLGLVAKLVTETTHDELRRMLENGTYTFHVDTVGNKPDELKAIFGHHEHCDIGAFCREGTTSDNWLGSGD